MVVFILVTIVTILFIPALILTIKHRFPRLAGSLLTTVLAVGFALNMVSALVHQLGDGAWYESRIKQKEEIVLRLASPETEEKATEEAKAFNVALTKEKEAAESPLFSFYAYRSASEHFTELYITLP